MSDPSAAAVRRPREESPTIDAVSRQLERLVDASEAESVVAFAEIFLTKATKDFLHGRSADTLAQIALGGWRFLQDSQPDRVDVEVFNPEIDSEGWYAPVTVLRTSLSERPFIVDSLREFLHNEGLSIEHLIYPVMQVERDESGEITSLRSSKDGESRESFVHREVSRIMDTDVRESLRREASRRLHDVIRVADDFHPMVDAVNSTVVELAECVGSLPELREELEEVLAFLRWLRDGAFVFLGCRKYDIVELDGSPTIVVRAESGLGVLRNEAESAFAEPVPVSEAEPGIRDLLMEGPHLIITKTNTRSTVHRLARMDYIGIKKFSSDGKVVGEHRFIGLFTSRAYGEDAHQIPILRRKLRVILEGVDAQEGSHDYKEINTMPKEELFLSSADEIAADIRTVLTSYHTGDVHVTLREDPLCRGVSAMAILPRERFSGEVRQAIEEALIQRFQAELLNYYLALGEGDQARLHFYLAARADGENDDDPAVRYAFFIEEAEAMAERLGALYLEIEQAGPRDFGAEEAVRMSVFQYMVGNTDWSMVRFDNAEVLQTSGDVYVPVPYDFDWTGFMSARYARLDERMGIRNVRQRMYRGFCRPTFDFSTVYSQFVDIRADLEALYTGQEGLDEDNARDAVQYLDDFYEDIESPQRARDRLERDCRGM